MDWNRTFPRPHGTLARAFEEAVELHTQHCLTPDLGYTVALPDCLAWSSSLIHDFLEEPWTDPRKHCTHPHSAQGQAGMSFGDANGSPPGCRHTVNAAGFPGAFLGLGSAKIKRQEADTQTWPRHRSRTPCSHCGPAGGLRCHGRNFSRSCPFLRR